ncbi:unnamed protein product [Haemonchus placei]|uniref:Uncharacterized protein n=1 Tax=Haemonchus placei TaxID=6290 RepID=A0A0N4WMA5_HAEPC|nr:unnamed protein product [Haemonchus placei]
MDSSQYDLFKRHERGNWLVPYYAAYVLSIALRDLTNAGTETESVAGDGCSDVSNASDTRLFTVVRKTSETTDTFNVLGESCENRGKTRN